ncbi:hypothetical protein P3T20_006673 [Paraburkholderia sp. GAS206C]
MFRLVSLLGSAISTDVPPPQDTLRLSCCQNGSRTQRKALGSARFAFSPRGGLVSYSDSRVSIHAACLCAASRVLAVRSGRREQQAACPTTACVARCRHQRRQGRCFRSHLCLRSRLRWPRLLTPAPTPPSLRATRPDAVLPRQRMPSAPARAVCRRRSPRRRHSPASAPPTTRHAPRPTLQSP